MDRVLVARWRGAQRFAHLLALGIDIGEGAQGPRAKMQPRTQYVKGPEGHVAYQVLGSGSRDIVFVPDHPNNIEIMWENPALSRFLERLATMGRVICFDKRGTGISDPVPLGAIPTIERWMDDVTTVIDEVGCKRIVVFGHGDGGPIWYWRGRRAGALRTALSQSLRQGIAFSAIPFLREWPRGGALTAILTATEQKNRQSSFDWGRRHR